MKNLFLLFALFLQATVFGQSKTVKNELLWEISGNGLKQKSYLYGSLHSNDKRHFRFSDSVYFALNESSALLLEMDLFELFDKLDTRRGEVKLMYDAEGNPYTGTNRASKTVYGDENGMPQFLDAYFQEYASVAGKSFYALESFEDQMNALDGIPGIENEQLALFTAEMLEERMIELYIQGDIQGLDKIMKVNLKTYPGSYDQLIVKRNKTMLTGIDSIIRKNSTFCAVGAGHLGGDEGLIQLLRKKGYKVRPVMPVYSENAISEKKIILESRGYLYEDGTSGLVAKFPGKPREFADALFTTLLYRELGQGNTYSINIYPSEEETDLRTLATIHIASPTASPFKCRTLDDDSEVCEGISDAYPEGLQWVRIIRNDKYVIVLKTYGGNKFMSSNRPFKFFSEVGFEH